MEEIFYLPFVGVRRMWGFRDILFCMCVQEKSYLIYTYIYMFRRENVCARYN